MSASIGEVKMASKETMEEGAEASQVAIDEAKKEVEDSGNSILSVSPPKKFNFRYFKTR